jgi:hypothetical protein
MGCGQEGQIQGLVDELKNYMDTLENITSSLEQLSRRRRILESGIESAPSERSLRALREATVESGMVISDSASSRFLLLDDNEYCVAENSCSMPAPASSTHETFFSTLTHQTLHLGLDDGADRIGRATIEERPDNQTSIAYPVSRTQTIRDSFSPDEVEAQTRKSFDLKHGDTDVQVNSTTGLIPEFAHSNSHSKETKARQFKQLLEDTDTQVTLKTINGSLDGMLGIFLGAQDTPYMAGARWVKGLVEVRGMDEHHALEVTEHDAQ